LNIHSVFLATMDSTPNKRTIILETTLELVRERGIHGFPISDVAKEGGIAVGTIYHYFEGKEQLIQELYQYVVELIYHTAIEEDDPGKSFQERYFIFWNNLVNLYNSKPSILSFFELYNNSSYRSEESGEKKGQFYDWLFMFFEQGLKSGEIRSIDKEILAVLVLGNMHTSARVKMNRSFRPRENSLDLGEIAKVIWEGIRSRP
jgi:AcrR family transcriptional regulator